MAKTIKFNLICDGKPVRSIEDLQNNFSIEDILDYYNNKLLHRWLEVRGYEKELKGVNLIKGENVEHIIQELINIFNIELDAKKVKEKTYILKYLKERRELFALYSEEEFKVNHIIDDYQNNYQEIVKDIINNSNDISIIKANINEIIEKYYRIFELDYYRLFYEFLYDAKMAIFVMLANDKTRKFYLPSNVNYQDGSVNLDIDTIWGDGENIESKKAIMKKEVYEEIKKLDFSKILSANIQSFSGMTDSYWKDIEVKGKNFMIFSIGKDDYVRAAGKNGGDLGYKDIKDKFVIIDGIDYKSNSSRSNILFMEV